MSFKTVFVKAAVVGALGVPALGLGVGVGMASADPGGNGQSCGLFCPGDQRGDNGGDQGNRDNGGDQGFRDNGFRDNGGDQGNRDNGGDQGFRDNGFRDNGGDQGNRDNGGDGRRWDQRSIDDARFDHQPFNYEGQRVEPYFDNNFNAFGFQFFGIFIPL